MDGSEEKAAARWRQCGRLVQAVRAGTQEKKFYDESVKALRAQLRTEFEALLLEDYRYAQVPKALHYWPLYVPLHPLNVHHALSAACIATLLCMFDLTSPFEMRDRQLSI